MNVAENSGTSTSLLVRLQYAPFDQEAWAEFVDRYGRRIEAWCARWGLQEADALDVSQIVLLKLLRALQSFRYDRRNRFRAWLKVVTHHAWMDWVRDRRRTSTVGDDPIQSVAARDDLAEMIEGAYAQELYDNAVSRVRPRVLAQTWDAFYLTTYQGMSGAEVADRLGMPVTSVYKAKSNIRKLLEQEVHDLEKNGHE